MKTRLAIITGISVVIILVALYIFEFGASVQSILEKNPLAEMEPATQTQKEFGINSSDYLVCYDKIGRNENLSEILTRFDVSMAAINELATISKPVFDVRKLRTGRPYCVMQNKDTIASPAYFIYEKDPINYVVFELGDSLGIHTGRRPIKIRRKSAAGIINHSLFQTMVDEKLSFDLAIRMSEIYSWSIDFYRLQKGDHFRVVYEEKYVDDEYVGLGDIESCEFRHFDKDFMAFRYLQDSVYDFFDENANSLRKAFLKAPLKYSRISSGFSNRRFHPILKRYTSHLGIDYAAPHGTPIYAVGDGVILDARYQGNNGNFVKIRHNGTYSTQYLHMSRFGEGIKPGSVVTQGQVIGYIGSTGLSTGPHVCFRFWKNGQQVNPFKEEIPPAEPVRPECQNHYEETKEALLKELMSIDIPSSNT